MIGVVLEPEIADEVLCSLEDRDHGSLPDSLRCPFDFA